MKTIKNSKEITTLEVGDVVIFGNLRYAVNKTYRNSSTIRYYLYYPTGYYNGIIFEKLNLRKKDFIEQLGIDANCNGDFPETKSLEALTAIVSALFKEYEKQNELPKTWEEFCERNKIGDKRFCLSHGDIIGTGVSQSIFRDTTLMESVKEAQAFRALMQLRQLYKAYIKDWKPDWMSDTEPKYCVDLQANDFSIRCWYHMNSPLSFPTSKLATQFLNNFKDLLEIAKPLL